MSRSEMSSSEDASAPCGQENRQSLIGGLTERLDDLEIVTNLRNRVIALTTENLNLRAIIETMAQFVPANKKRSTLEEDESLQGEVEDDVGDGSEKSDYMRMPEMGPEADDENDLPRTYEAGNASSHHSTPQASSKGKGKGRAPTPPKKQLQTYSKKRQADHISADTQTEPKRRGGPPRDSVTTLPSKVDSAEPADTTGESQTEAVILDVADIRQPDFFCDSLPDGINAKLVQQVRAWDNRRPQWEMVSKWHCANTFTIRNLSQWQLEGGQLDTTHACFLCERSRRLCVATVSPGKVQVLARKLRHEDESCILDPVDVAYWLKPIGN